MPWRLGAESGYEQEYLKLLGEILLHVWGTRCPFRSEGMVFMGFAGILINVP